MSIHRCSVLKICDSIKMHDSLLQSLIQVIESQYKVEPCLLYDYYKSYL